MDLEDRTLGEVLGGKEKVRELWGYLQERHLPFLIGEYKIYLGSGRAGCLDIPYFFPSNFILYHMGDLTHKTLVDFFGWKWDGTKFLDFNQYVYNGVGEVVHIFLQKFCKQNETTLLGLFPEKDKSISS